MNNSYSESMKSSILKLPFENENKVASTLFAINFIITILVSVLIRQNFQPKFAFFQIQQKSPQKKDKQLRKFKSGHKLSTTYAIFFSSAQCNCLPGCNEVTYLKTGTYSDLKIEYYKNASEVDEAEYK